MILHHVAREQITVSNTATNCTAATVTNAVQYADIQVQSYQIRVTFDGSTAPVAATTGTLWNPGSVWRVWGNENVENLKFIREGDNDATLVCNYWGRSS